jgi:hypothetical protein
MIPIGNFTGGRVEKKVLMMKIIFETKPSKTGQRRVIRLEIIYMAEQRLPGQLVYILYIKFSCHNVSYHTPPKRFDRFL